MLEAFTGLAKSYRAGEDIEEGEERREEGKRRKRRGKKEREEGKEGKIKIVESLDMCQDGTRECNSDYGALWSTLQ